MKASKRHGQKKNFDKSGYRVAEKIREEEKRQRGKEEKQSREKQG
jgi:hypothetical protein